MLSFIDYLLLRINEFLVLILQPPLGHLQLPTGLDKLLAQAAIDGQLPAVCFHGHITTGDQFLKLGLAFLLPALRGTQFNSCCIQEGGMVG